MKVFFEFDFFISFVVGLMMCVFIVFFCLFSLCLLIAIWIIVYYKEGEIARIESGEYPRLAETDYVLVEFPYEMRYKEIHRALNKVILLGLTPVVAHVERYNDVDEKVFRN